jgi:hypothetical protein
MNYIRYMLAKFSSVHHFQIPSLSDQIFELYCYFRKIEEFADSGKIPLCQSKSPGIFRLHAKPGKPRTADYFRLVDPQHGEDRDLILNGEFEGVSGISHSPDIVLTKSDEDKIISIYECKNYSGSIGPGIYREINWLL